MRAPVRPDLRRELGEKMPNYAMYQLISGAVMMGSWVAALFFFRFWRKSRDPLFYIFGLAFILMGCERMILGFKSSPNEAELEFYLIRISAFFLIIIGIIQKNRVQKR
jgi:uncharacterized membrane protein HdeD (DUF308 family)